MSRRYAFFAAALCLGFLSPAPLLATSYDHWYQPHYMASAEDASNRLQFLAPHFIPGNGGGTSVWLNSSFSFTNMTESTLGINLFFTQTGVEDVPQGLLGLTSISTPFTKNVVSTIVYADIDYYMVEGLTASTSKFPWCIYPFRDHKMQNSVICVTSESDAHQVVDALATLAGANGKDLGTDPGIWLLPATSKELRKHPERVCQAYFVEVDGPPEQAGMQSGDLLHTVNGAPCTNEVVYAAVAAAAKSPSGNMHVEVLRKGQPLAFDLHYPNRDAAGAQSSQQSAGSARHPVGSVIGLPSDTQAAPPAAVHFGFQVRPVIHDDIVPLALTNAQGLVVVSVENGGLADTMGILAGDVILKVNGADVGDLSHFKQLIHSDTVTIFNVWRKGKTLELTVPQSM